MFCDAGARHRRAGRAVRALLHVARRSGGALLLVLPRLHGRDAGRGAVGQPDPARVLLGAHQPVLVPADRLLAPPARRAARRAHGAHRDRRRRPVRCSAACWCSATSSAATTSTRVLASGDRSRAAHPLYPVALVLVLLGALTKSAQFPFHFWLPRAMAAPTPVSAYLHSATMVKAGVFLLARLWPVLSGTEAVVLARRRRGRRRRCCSAPTSRCSSTT